MFKYSGRARYEGLPGSARDRRARRALRLRPVGEGLEGRALLSTGGGDAAGFVTGLYQDVLHREPDAPGLAFWVRTLDRGASRLRVEARFLASTEYARAHDNTAAFVHGLYGDVLDRASDPRGEAFWENVLDRHEAGRAQVALAFVRSPGSQLGRGASGSSLGRVQSVNVTPGPSSSAIIGNTAQVGINYNGGDFLPRTVTLQVSGAGSYVLDQSTTFNILNNTGRRWIGYNFAILSASSAKPTFVNSFDVSGQLPTVRLTTSSIAYSGGTGVPSGFVNPFLPKTIINTTRGGTIVVLETPLPSNS